MTLRKSAGDALIRWVAVRQLKPRDCVIIAANPRGGSTWLEQILAQIPGTLSVYEPLNIAYAQRFRTLGFSHRQHIAEDEEWPAAEAVFSDLFHGRYLEHRAVFHPNTRNSVWAFLNPQILLMKFCRLNLMLPWIVRKFPVRRPIFLLRNPFAQIASQIEFARKFSGTWVEKSFPFSDYPIPPVYQDYAAYLAGLRSQEEVLAGLWCLTNKIPLEHPGSNKLWININYESLYSEPEGRLRAIFDRLDLGFKSHYLNVVRVPSRTSISEVDIAKWKKTLDENQVERISAVLKRFGLFHYYELSEKPVIDISTI
jgi:hypothetical protein